MPDPHSDGDFHIKQPVIGTDEFGLPTHITEDEREVTGMTEGQESQEAFVDLNGQPAELDRVRVRFRCGAEFSFEEMWQTGIIVLSLRTEKGVREFAVFDPRHSGYQAMKCQSPLEIL